MAICNRYTYIVLYMLLDVVLPVNICPFEGTENYNFIRIFYWYLQLVCN
jgi:hypothetical protein